MARTKEEISEISKKEKARLGLADDGKFIRDSDGEEYSLVILDEHRLGRTYQASNKRHYWEGTKEQFIAAFKSKKPVLDPQPTPVPAVDLAPDADKKPAE